MLRSSEISGYRADAVTEEVDGSAAADLVNKLQRQKSSKATGNAPQGKPSIPGRSLLKTLINVLLN